MKRTSHGNLVSKPGISPFKLRKVAVKYKNIVLYPSEPPAVPDTPERDKHLAELIPGYQPDTAKAGSAAKGGRKTTAKSKKKTTTKQKKVEKKRKAETPSEEDSLGDLPVSKSQKKGK